MSDFIGRRWSIIGASVVSIITGWIYAKFSAASDPALVLSVGFVLITAIYIQTAILFGVYTPELFPTEVRLRANGICNTLGRLATVFSPFAVGYLMLNYRLPGVIGMMIALLVVQIVAVVAVILDHHWKEWPIYGTYIFPVQWIAYLAIWFMVCVSLVSAIDYFAAFWSRIDRRVEKRRRRAANASDRPLVSHIRSTIPSATLTTSSSAISFGAVIIPSV